MSLMIGNEYKPKRKIIELSITERCNLSCSYCYEHNKDILNMAQDIAKNAIKNAFTDGSFDEIEIDFFGGEPFAAFKDIRAICEWLWQQEWPKPFIVYATTNGTMIHGAIKEWVQKNSYRFVLGLSIDGTPEMHNINRNNSFDQIDIDFFSSSWPLQPVKMTLSRATVSNLANGVIYLHNRGFKVLCNNAYGIEWKEEDYSVFAEQLKKLTDFYIENPDVEPSIILVMPIQNIVSKSKLSKWCGAGTNMITISRTGKTYPCHTFLPSVVSSNDSDLENVFELLKSGNLFDIQCNDCPIISCCPTCYGISYVETSDITKRNKSHCVFSKIRAKATAYMLSNMLINRQRNYTILENKSPEDILKIIKAIDIIAKEIKI